MQRGVCGIDQQDTGSYQYDLLQGSTALDTLMQGWNQVGDGDVDKTGRRNRQHKRQRRLHLLQCEPGQHATCGQLLALAGHYADAGDQFGAAAAFFPAAGRFGAGNEPPEMLVRLWLEQVWWNLAAGRIAQARQQAHSYAGHTSASSREGGFFRRVGAIPGDYE